MGGRSICFAEAARFIPRFRGVADAAPSTENRIRPLRVPVNTCGPVRVLALPPRITVLSCCYERARARACS
jgi:hypothetical protein